MNAVAVLAILISQAFLLCAAQRPVGDRLIKVLLNDYVRESIPLRNISDTVAVNMDLTLTRVVDYDEDTSIVTIMGWLMMSWHDFRLDWDPAEFNNLKMIRIPDEQIWTPDIMLYNMVDSKTSFSPVNAVASQDGFVIWVPPIQMAFPCEQKGNGEYNCTATFGSWTFDGFQLDVHTKKLDISFLSKNPRLAVSDPQTKRNERMYPCCEEPYPNVEFSFKLTAKEH